MTVDRDRYEYLLDKERRKRAPYDTCTTCEALAGNPCRNLSYSAVGNRARRTQPHPGRAQLDQR